MSIFDQLQATSFVFKFSIRSDESEVESIYLQFVRCQRVRTKVFKPFSSIGNQIEALCNQASSKDNDRELECAVRCRQPLTCQSLTAFCLYKHRSALAGAFERSKWLQCCESFPAVFPVYEIPLHCIQVRQVCTISALDLRITENRAKKN